MIVPHPVEHESCFAVEDLPCEGSVPVIAGGGFHTEGGIEPSDFAEVSSVRRQCRLHRREQRHSAC
ncbi:MAG: hypothetical protein LBU65_01720 [Planctomycetaceae bacterium]|nr:hypothetical protein [Planctomycetaceae bacterium]